jgi:predicted transcriptional regulator
MRMHIEVDDDLIARVDEVSGPRGRSGFVRRAIEQAVERETRWRLIESAAGVLQDENHPWDEAPGAWVREQRRGDERRGG